jgi:hypothetical protein
MNLPNINSIRTIESTEQIADTIDAINNNYYTLQLWASAIQQEYDIRWQPIINYYNQYAASLTDTFSLAQTLSSDWDNFQTIVESNSAKWLQPFTIFYPTLILNNVTDDTITTIIDWLRQYFPIKNNDNTLNYVEGQILIVNCYTYSYSDTINIKDEPYSYAKCNTTSGTIYAKCQTKISGAPIHCGSGAVYTCDLTLVTNPSKHVDCWFSSPYLYDIGSYGSPITDTDFSTSKQNVKGQIKTNINMDYTDQNETGIETLVFKVYDCDWQYNGGVKVVTDIQINNNFLTQEDGSLILQENGSNIYL